MPHFDGKKLIISTTSDLNISDLSLIFAHFINLSIKIRSLNQNKPKTKKNFVKSKLTCRSHIHVFSRFLGENVLFRAFCCSLHCYFSAKFHRIFIFENFHKNLVFPNPQALNSLLLKYVLDQTRPQVQFFFVKTLAIIPRKAFLKKCPSSPLQDRGRVI